MTARWWKLTNFSVDITRLPPPLPLWREFRDKSTVKKLSPGGIVATSANYIVPSSYKNVHQTRLSSWKVEGRSGKKVLNSYQTLQTFLMEHGRPFARSMVQVPLWVIQVPWPPQCFVLWFVFSTVQYTGVEERWPTTCSNTHIHVPHIHVLAVATI